jgi:hypothetical protein
MGFKITDYPAKTAFDDGDLYDVSSYDGVSVYTSEKMTFAQLKTELNSSLSTPNLYNADGSLTAARTVTLTSVNTLTFNGGVTTFKGEDATASNYSIIAQDNLSADIFKVRNDGNFEFGKAALSSTIFEINNTSTYNTLQLKPTKVGALPLDINFPLAASQQVYFDNAGSGYWFRSSAGGSLMSFDHPSNTTWTFNKKSSGAINVFAFGNGLAQSHHTFGVDSTNAGNVVLNVRNETTGDLQVKGLTNDNLLYTDASADLVGIGKVPVDGILDINLATEDAAIVDAGSVGATEQDWIEVTVGSVQGYIRVYATK